MATVRNANEIDPAKLAFEIDATGRIKAKYDGLQGLMIDEKKAFVMEENGGFYTLDLTDLSAVDGQTNPPRTSSSSCSRPWTRNSANPSVRIKVDKESGQAFYKYLNMRIRTQTMAGKRKTVPVVDMSNYLITERATIGTGDLLAFKPYDNEADFEPYLNPESMYAAPMQ
eukprot:tig00020567_g11513.t1